MLLELLPFTYPVIVVCTKYYDYNRILNNRHVYNIYIMIWFKQIYKSVCELFLFHVKANQFGTAGRFPLNRFCYASVFDAISFNASRIKYKGLKQSVRASGADYDRLSTALMTMIRLSPYVWKAESKQRLPGPCTRVNNRVGEKNDRNTCDSSTLYCFWCSRNKSTD